MWWACRSMRPPGGALATPGTRPAHCVSPAAAGGAVMPTAARPVPAAAAAPVPSRARRVIWSDTGGLQLECHVDEQVLLAADEPALAGDVEQRGHVDAGLVAAADD